jgi:hypothetical protein
MKLFEYVMILHPSEKEQEDGKQSTLLNGGVEHVLANDERAALMLAGRHIPEEHLDKLDRIEVAVRPF